jgi:hypothetical protein
MRWFQFDGPHKFVRETAERKGIVIMLRFQIRLINEQMNHQDRWPTSFCATQTVAYV